MLRWPTALPVDAGEKFVSSRPVRALFCSERRKALQRTETRIGFLAWPAVFICESNLMRCFHDLLQDGDELYRPVMYFH